jgi:glycoside/pentoside/hexuronide:cation symporter, GPH family
LNPTENRAVVAPPAAAGGANISPEERVSLRHKFAYGLGAVTDMVGFHGPVTLVNPIFNITLGLNPALIGVAKGLCRVWDAITDPTMGTISDHSTSRFGRRRPFIVGGAVAMGIAFLALFAVPRGLGSWGLFAFLTAMLLLFYSAFTVFTVPYHALGYELAVTYDDRTRVMAWRLAFNMVGNTIVSWLFAATQLPVFRDTMEGAIYVGAFTGILIIACGVIPGLLVPERRHVATHRLGPVRAELKSVLRNRPFLRLVGLALLYLTAATVSGMLADYVNFYHVYGGDLRSAAVVSSSGVTIGYAVTLLSAFGWTWLGSRFDKKTILFVTLVLNGVFSASTWWLFTPTHP